MHSRSCATVSEAASRLLREGDAGASSDLPGPSLSAIEALTKAMPPQPVSLLMLQSAAQNQTVQHRILQAKFIRREMIARRAHILTLLHAPPLAAQPAVKQAVSLYWDRLRGLLEVPAPETEAEEREFFARQKERNDALVAYGNDEEERMCLDALRGMQQELGSEWWADFPDERVSVDRQLDAIFLARIGLRFLLEHYVACDQHLDGHAGILRMQCSPVRMCEALAAQTQAQLRATYGVAPPIEVVGDASRTFTFVPALLEYVAGTLLKNSSVATLRKVADGGEPAGLAGVREASIPAVRCVVAVSDRVVQLKFADEAGGIRRSSLINVWSYRALRSKWWAPADGLSLPLARLYCKYFGGQLSLVPMEGFGTDCYVYLNRLAQANSEHILPDPTNRNEEGQTEFVHGVFEAQSRRTRDLQE